MSERKPHLRIDEFRERQDYASRHQGRPDEIPELNRQDHGGLLLRQYGVALVNADLHRAQTAQEFITAETGVYLELRSPPHQKLPLDRLDTARDYRLQSMHVVDGSEVAVIFVPDSRRVILQRKLEQYLNPQRDSRSGKPANQPLIDSIAEIRLAQLQSFWTDHPSLFPDDRNAVRWWELWLNKQPGVDLLATARAFAERVGARVGNTALTFHNCAVVIIRASVSQLQSATELISCLAELRQAKDTPSVLVRARPGEQQAWAANLLSRLRVEAEGDLYVSILDTGVNFDHPILSRVCDATLATCWKDTWPRYSPAGGNGMHHGSQQAGLAILGDMLAAVLSDDQVVVNHMIESGRVLPPTGNNDPELYGAITVETAARLEAARPDAKRVYSMAVTASSERQGGQPSSWSSTLDSFCSGEVDGKRRLMVLATGNNRDIRPDLDYWDQAQLSEIEDPAQTWNALTVGAYSGLTTNDEDDYDGWSPFAESGDICPRSRTSLDWPWRKHAPYKPDVVAEGGNVLLSPDRTEIIDSDSVSLLTTSGQSTGQLFASTGATSSATALVSHQLALLMAEHPDLWPETHRALLVHSAEWTARMYERKGQLAMRHSERIVNETMLRIFGHGVPNIDRARYSANHVLTLIAQNELQPYKRPADAQPSTDATLNEMHLYELPWPRDTLEAIDPDVELRMNVTLSYFVEPNPGRRGYRDRFTYPSHSFRFAVIRPEQSLQNFTAYINNHADREDYAGPEGNADGWRYGPQARTRGSLHRDVWTGSAADLARMNAIAVYPVSGWWKSRKSEGRWNKEARYSLIVSIESPDQNLDIYTEVSNAIAAEIMV